MPETYSPGPWVWFYRDRLYQDRADSGPMPTVLAAHDGGEINVSDADANLIAAAPDLLTALELIVTTEHPGVRLTPDQLAVAHAALAKAKGEPNAE